MPDRIVLLFHGLGGDRDAMEPVREYCTRLLSPTEFISIEGPINFGESAQPCLGWFDPPEDDRRSLDGPHPPALSGLEASLTVVRETLDSLVNRGVDPQRIHLLGHSQGGAMALTVGLTYPGRLGSVITIAGYLALTPNMQPSPSGTRFFLHHSEYDDNVSFRWAAYAKDFVERTGDPCIVHPWKIRENPHSIHGAQLDAICATLAGG